MTIDDPAARLQEISTLDDSIIDLAQAALCLAALAQPGIVLERYAHHLQKLAEETGGRHKELIGAGAEDNAETQLAALKHIIADKYEYTGDNENYNDLQNASLLRVIDRRRGMPVSLSILYISVARSLGWDVAGMDFPGHFLCRIEKDGRRIIFDPFSACKILTAPEMRAILKKTLGADAELSADYFLPASARAILMRLQNNIKYRQIESEDYEGALRTVEGMRMVNPGEYRLLLDEGVLKARTNRVESAIEALEEYIRKAPGSRDRQEAAILLRELQESLR